MRRAIAIAVRAARRHVFAVMFAFVAIMAAVMLLRHDHSRPKLVPSVFVTSFPYRVVEPRLSGSWAYKPLRDQPVALHRASLAATTRGELNTRVTGDDGVAFLLTGATDQAVETLEASAWQSGNASQLNDLAAALLVQSDERDDAALAADALGAVDAALAANPRSEAALFNRALALGRLALAAESRRAWTKYLAVDHSSRWADEALHNLSSLGVTSQSDEWDHEFAAARSLPPTAVTATIGNLAWRFPEQARLWGEGEALDDWAVAALRGDRIAAASHLALIRQVATTLRDRSGESLLADVVSTVDRAVACGEWERLAHAHKMFWDGREAHRQGHPAEAESKFHESERLFAACDSPMIYLARYYTGSALHAQLKLAEAARFLDALARERLDRRGYRAVDATLGWERGACFMERGELSAAMELFTRSRDALRALGEIHVPAVFDAFLASAFDYAGDEAEAWRARRRAFEGMSRSGYRYRLLVAIEAAAAAAMRGSKWNRAAALLSMTTTEAMRQSEPAIAAEAFAFRAWLNAERGDFAAARQDEQSAQYWAGKLSDPSTRARFDATLAFVDGLSHRTDDPGAAITRFSDALQFFERSDRRVEVPRIYLERALLRERLGDIAVARDDLAAGITFIESERRQIHDPAQRATLLATWDRLFENAIRLAMRSGQQEAAFALSESHRARALTEMFELGPAASNRDVEPMSVAAIRASLASNAAIVEYEFWSDSLVIFVIRRDFFTAIATPVGRERLDYMVSAAEKTVNDASGDYRVPLADADAVLLQPVRESLVGARHIAIIPTPNLSGFPFAALYDAATGRFLIEEASLTMAPSATLSVVASAGVHPTAHPSIISVAGDAFDIERYPHAQPLHWAPREVTAVASLYAKSHVFAAREATPASVTDGLRRYDVAHFAAHGIVKRPVADSAILLAPSGETGGELRVRDIAKLDLHGLGVAVLAACRSGAPATHSDGPENLALSFLAASVPATIASLTDFDDAVAAPLMVALHRHLAEGADPAAAVRDVALSELRDARGNIQRPMVWSNLVVIGGSGELMRTERKEKR